MPFSKKKEPGRAAVTKEFTILNQYGIHARPAALLVKTLSKFQSDVTIQRGEARVSGKSIMGLMTLEAAKGAVIRVTAEGEDAEQALAEIRTLIDKKFYEE